MSAGTLLPVSSLSPEAETDSPQTEVAGHHTLTLQGSGSHKDIIKGPEIIVITQSDWWGGIIDFMRTNPSHCFF